MPDSQAETIQGEVSSLLSSIQRFVSEISMAIPGRSLNGDIMLSIEAQLEKFAFLANPPHDLCREIDIIGTALWNACGPGATTRFVTREDLKILSRARAIAFILIESMASTNIGGNFRALKAALPAAHSCIETSQLKLALRILEASAQRLDALKRAGSSADQSRVEAFTVEYSTLRARLAWLQNRPDLAEHFFSQVPLSSAMTNRNCVVETCYKVGCQAIAMGQFDNAIGWLGKALEQMEKLRNEHTTEDKKNMDLLIRHALVRSYSVTNTEEAKKGLAEQFGILQKEHADAPAVKSLELEIIRNELDRDDDTNLNKFFQVLGEIICHVELTEPNFEIVFGYVKYSQFVSQELCIKALVALLQHVPMDKCENVERCFLKLVTMVISFKIPGEACLASIKHAVQVLEERGMEFMGTDTVHACLILIWKHIDKSYRDQQYRLTAEWCQFALNTRILKNRVECNKLIILKRLVLSALNDNNTALAREAFDQIPPETEMCGGPEAIPHMLYLKFRLALQEGKGVAKILEHEYNLWFGGSAGVDYDSKKEFLQMCILEAQRLDKPAEVLTCLLYYRLWLERRDPDVYLFALYVLTVEFQKGHIRIRNIEMMLEVLHAALPLAQWRSKGAGSFTDSELKWICQEGYRLCDALLKVSNLEYIPDALQITEELVMIYKDRSNADKRFADQLILRMTYISAIWHFVSLRSNDYTQKEKNVHYKEITEYVSRLETFRSVTNDNVAIIRNLLVLGMEAAICTKNWKEAVLLFDNNKCFLCEEMCFQFVESILTFGMPSNYRVWLLRNILISLYRDLEITHSTRRLFPFFLRVLFHICLSVEDPSKQLEPVYNHIPQGFEGETYFELADLVLTQAITTAEDEIYVLSDEHRQRHIDHDQAVDAQTPTACLQFPYPKAELLHLSAVAFNRAVDFWFMERFEEFQRWSQKAVRLAQVVNDDEGFQFAASLQERVDSLAAEM